MIASQAALEARSHGIRVNAVSPGFLYTQMVTQGLEELPGPVQDAWDAVIARQGRNATHDEIGDAVVLLSTPKMSLVNGHNLVCDKYARLRIQSIRYNITKALLTCV